MVNQSMNSILVIEFWRKFCYQIVLRKKKPVDLQRGFDMIEYHLVICQRDLSQQLQESGSTTQKVKDNNKLYMDRRKDNWNF